MTDQTNDRSPARVVVTRRMPAPGSASLEAAGLVVDHCRLDPDDRATDVARLLPEASAVVATLTESIDAELLASAPRLKVVANLAVGFDNIDLQAAADCGIVVTNTPDVLTEATADLAWALLLAAARRVAEGDRMVRSGGWPGWAPDQLLGAPVAGKVLGIVGLGRIGAAVARRADGFAMEVLTCSRTPKPDIEPRWNDARVDLDELLVRSDLVMVTAPLNDSTHHLIDARRLGLMAPTAVLVNLGRGPVVDEGALVAALRDGTIAAAALDVYEFEPTVSDALRALPNVVLSPHLGSATTDTRATMVELCCRNVLAVLRGEQPETPVPLPSPSA